MQQKPIIMFRLLGYWVLKPAKRDFERDEIIGLLGFETCPKPNNLIRLLGYLGFETCPKPNNLDIRLFRLLGFETCSKPNNLIH